MNSYLPAANQGHSFRHAVWFCLLLLAAVIVLITASAEAASVIYVKADASGANNGSSWTDAYTDLQSALTNATAGDEIWVAAGTYKPTTGDDRNASFVMKSGVKLFGGFAGTETSLDQREIAAHPTTLSGDLLDNDNNNLALDESTRQDNSHTVVYIGAVDNATRLDGFTVTGGHAIDSGAGIYNSNGSMVLSNLIIINNVATNSGGGIYNGFADSEVVNVRLLNNLAELGGGFYNRQGSPRLMNVAFSGNHATSRGGALYSNISGDLRMVNVTVSNNSADVSGGAIGRYDGAFSIKNSVFWENGFNSIDSSPFATTPIAIDYSLVQNGYTGTGNIDSNPQFTDADGADNVAGTIDDVLTLSSTSPAIDAGQNSAVPGDGADLDIDGDIAEVTPRDLALDERFHDHPNPDTGSGSPPVVDMGAYEAGDPAATVAVSGQVRNSSDNAPVAGVIVSILHVEGLEVTQAVQTVNNTIPLVQDKPTIARIYAPTNGPTSPLPVSVMLSGSKNNVPLAGSPLSVGPSNLANKTSPSRAEYESSFNVRLPASWLAGDVTLTAGLDMSAGYADFTDSNGKYTLNLPPGTYTIAPQKEGQTFSPVSRTVTLPSTEAIDFTMTRERAIYLPTVIKSGSTRAGRAPATQAGSAYSQQKTVTARFTELAPFRLTIVPIRYTSALNGQTYEPPTDFSGIVANLAQTYPVPNVELETHAIVEVTGESGQPALYPVLDELVLLKENEGAPAYRVYYGVTASDLPAADVQGTYGWAEVGSRVASAVGAGSFLAIHEIGHNFGLGHSCNDPGFPYQDGSTGEYGLNVELEVVFPPDKTADFMSTTTCPIDNPDLVFNWFSDYHYQKLYDDQLANGTRAVAPISTRERISFGPLQ